MNIVTIDGIDCTMSVDGQLILVPPRIVPSRRKIELTYRIDKNLTDAYGNLFSQSDIDRCIEQGFDVEIRQF